MELYKIVSALVIIVNLFVFALFAKKLYYYENIGDTPLILICISALSFFVIQTKGKFFT